MTIGCGFALAKVEGLEVVLLVEVTLACICIEVVKVVERIFACIIWASASGILIEENASSKTRGQINPVDKPTEHDFIGVSFLFTRRSARCGRGR